MKLWTPLDDAQACPDLSHHIGYDLLGPVVQRWLLALHQHLLYHDDGSTAPLFCARAGLRIAELYGIFARERGRKAPAPRTLWTSRIAVAKGVFGRPGGRDRSVELLTREYYHEPLRDLALGLVRHRPDVFDGLDLGDRALDAHGHNFPGWLTVNGPVQRRLRDFLEESSVAFDAELRRLLDGCERALLIDSGWQGTAQSLLAAAYPDIAWRGLYFGRILTPRHDPRIVPDCIGLLFEAESYDPARPETAFVRHRHLIEALLEPNAPSVEDIRNGPAGDAAERMIAACCGAVPDPQTDALYLHVRKYVEDHSGQDIVGILSSYATSMPALARTIVRPRREEVAVMAAKARSADFGKDFSVPVVIEAEAGQPHGPEERIRKALWPEGQIALEYPQAKAQEAQDLVSGQVTTGDHFDPAGSHRAPAVTGTTRPRVAVVTRTKNRPLLLRRAARSVADQTLESFLWTVVNDGGDAEEAAAVMRGTDIDPRRMQLVSHDRSQGMEAASNAGIAACDSDYVVIHDDDDSWSPEFLQRTVAFLDSPAGARYGGVVTHSVYVSEEIRGDSVIEHQRRPYNDWVRNVQLSEMACGNFFPPIAFVFRRSVWDRVGGFNEALPVLGDWFFNMEVLLEDDIAVLPEALAYYHHRDRGNVAAGSYANSVIGGVSKHEEFAAVARNTFLRRHGERAGIAACFAMGYAVNDLRGRIERDAGHDASPPAIRNGGTDDRLWCAAEYNRHLATKPWWRRPFRARPVSPDIAWNDLAAQLRASSLSPQPPQEFDEAGYLGANPDVDKAVREGKFSSGYEHFVLHGRAEGRERRTRC